MTNWNTSPKRFEQLPFPSWKLGPLDKNYEIKDNFSSSKPRRSSMITFDNQTIRKPEEKKVWLKREKPYKTDKALTLIKPRSRHSIPFSKQISRQRHFSNKLQEIGKITKNIDYRSPPSSVVFDEKRRSVDPAQSSFRRISMGHGERSTFRPKITDQLEYDVQPPKPQDGLLDMKKQTPRKSSYYFSPQHQRFEPGKYEPKFSLVEPKVHCPSFPKYTSRSVNKHLHLPRPFDDSIDYRVARKSGFGEQPSSVNVDFLMQNSSRDGSNSIAGLTHRVDRMLKQLDVENRAFRRASGHFQRQRTLKKRIARLHARYHSSSSKPPPSPSPTSGSRPHSRSKSRSRRTFVTSS